MMLSSSLSNPKTVILAQLCLTSCLDQLLGIFEAILQQLSFKIYCHSYFIEIERTPTFFFLLDVFDLDGGQRAVGIVRKQKV